MLIFTMYGGGFATIPAYLADLFGTRYVGGIHGRLLTAWSTAGVLGPWAITSLRERGSAQAIRELAAQVDPARFAETFGASLEPARPPRRQQSRHAAAADGVGPARHDRSLRHALQFDDVFDGRAAGYRLDRQLARTPRRSAASCERLAVTDRAAGLHACRR